jgi:hypothetical protein
VPVKASRGVFAVDTSSPCDIFGTTRTSISHHDARAPKVNDVSPDPPKPPPPGSLAELFRQSQPLFQGPLAETESSLSGLLRAFGDLGKAVGDFARTDQLSPPPAPTIMGRWFKDQTIHIDGYTFELCRFDNCKLVTEFATFAFRRSFISPDCQVFFTGPSLKIARLLMHHLAQAGRVQKYPGEDAVFPTLNLDDTFTLE